MSDFTFTATAECWRCGAYLSSSSEECSDCAESRLQRYHFERIGGDSIQTVWAINPIRAWAELHEQDVDSVLPWRLYETGLMSLEYAQIGYDVRELDDLRYRNS